MFFKIQDGMNRGASARGPFPGDPIHSFMVNQGLGSPVLNRNSLMTSPGLTSPGMMSPGMLMGQLSPDMGQFSGRTPVGRMGRMVDPSALPGPPLNAFDSMSQMTAQQQAAMMMNAQLGNSFSSNMGSVNLMSPQQIQLQNQLNAQQAAMNQMSQQLQQQQQQLKNSQSEFVEMQMLQSKLQSLTRQNLVSPNMNSQAGMFQNANSSQFDPRQMDQMPPPPPVQGETPRQRNSNGTSDYTPATVSSSSQQKSQRGGNVPQNSRRIPPTSQLKRENSLKMEKVFNANSPTSTKKKHDGNGSSAHLSAMSLSIGDMNEEGNFSSVFDSSLRISTSSEKAEAQALKEKLKDRSSNTSWNPDNLDMSVGTIGRMSDTGNMSYATLGDSKLHESDGNMSFSKVFEDPDKQG